MCTQLLPEPRIVRFNAADALQGYVIHGGPWQAIAIGPESDIDRCTIVAEGAGVPVQTSGGITGSVDRQVDISNRAFAVSVERPWLGPVQGPLNVLMPYAKAIYAGAGGSDRLRSDTSNPLWQQFTGRPDFTARIELILYPFLPPWLPTKRAPMEWVYKYPQFGTTGEGGGFGINIYVPGYGRKSVELSIGATGLASGSLNWGFIGYNQAEQDDGFAVVSSSHTLQATTTETASFDRTYAFDGEFDMYILTLAENGALPADVTVEGFIKAWD